MGAAEGVAGALFVATFLLLALGRIGRLPVPRGAAALAGGVATALVLRLGWQEVDLQVIALLAGLMVVAGLAEEAGLFAGLRRRLVGLRPALALWLSLALMALTSAVLLNDAAVVVLVPFLLPTLRSLGLPPVPTVTLLAVAANLGSLLTPFGNPQNAALASHAGLSLRDFLAVQAPLVALGLALLGPASWWVARGAPSVPAAVPPVPPAVARGRPWLLLCIALFVALAAANGSLGLGLGLAAAAAAVLAYAGLRLRLGRAADRAALRGLDWNVLALFVGLYFLTGGLPRWLPSQRPSLSALDGPAAAALATVLSSNAVGNVPAMLAFIRLDPAWAALHAPFLVAVSTLGGALLLTGSAASLLAADQARRLGVEVRFLPFLAHAAPWVLPILLAGAWWTW